MVHTMNNRLFVTRVELDGILKELETPPDHENLKTLISLYGIAGAGKTTLLDMVYEEIARRRLNLVYFRINEDVKYDSLPEFVDALTMTFFSTVTNTAARFDGLHSEVVRYQKIAGKIESVFTEEEKRDFENIKEKAAKAAKKEGKRKFSLPRIKIGKVEIEAVGYEGQELEGKDEARVLLEYCEEEKKRIIAERYKSVEDQEYFLNPAPKITSSFLSCLQDSLYPRRWYLFKKDNSEKAPLKILFVFDTYEKIGQDVTDWLLQSLFPQLQEPRNKEFFDTRFIISGREQLSLSDHYRRWDKYGHKLLEFDIHRFTKDQVKQYLEKNGLQISLLDEAYSETEGLAYLLKIWADTRGEGSALIYGQAANRIFWWKSDEEKNWIRAASFCDYYNRDSLAVFLGIEKGKEAFDWLKECHEVTRTSEIRQNKYQLHPTVRKVVCRSVQQESDELFQDYTNRAKTYADVTAHFPNVSDRETMLKLCIFRHFNQSILDEIYPTEGFPLHNFAKEHKEYFNELKQTFEMRSEFQQLLYRYYSWRDHLRMLGYVNKVKGLWEEKRRQTDLEVIRLQEQVGDIKNQIKQLTSEIHSIDGNLQEYRERADAHKSVNEIRSEVLQKQSLVPQIALILLIFAALSGFAAIFLPGAIRTTLISIFVVFLMGGLLGAITSRFLHVQKIDRSNDKGSIEDSRKSMEYRLHMEKDRSALESQKEELVRRLNKVEEELERHKEILTEPYV